MFMLMFTDMFMFALQRGWMYNGVRRSHWNSVTRNRMDSDYGFGGIIDDENSCIMRWTQHGEKDLYYVGNQGLRRAA